MIALPPQSDGNFFILARIVDGVADQIVNNLLDFIRIGAGIQFVFDFAR